VRWLRWSHMLRASAEMLAAGLASALCRTRPHMYVTHEPQCVHLCLRVCARARVCACARACVRAFVPVSVPVRERARVCELARSQMYITYPHMHSLTHARTSAAAQLSALCRAGWRPPHGGGSRRPMCRALRIVRRSLRTPACSSSSRQCARMGLRPPAGAGGAALRCNMLR
jgi:hypothetical protein